MALLQGSHPSPGDSGLACASVSSQRQGAKRTSAKIKILFSSLSKCSLAAEAEAVQVAENPGIYGQRLKEEVM